MSHLAADTLTAEGNELFQRQQYADAATRFERAVVVYPTHPQAWKGLGHALLCLGRPVDAARAFDRAVGLRPDSATALWGGALAHADLGHGIVARNYLLRALALQPSWIEMARGVPQLAAFLRLSARAAELLRMALGTHSARSFQHASDEGRSLDVLRVGDSPERGMVTYASLGLCDHTWREEGRPRVEVLLASTIDREVNAQIVANVAFHLQDKGFFPEPGTMMRDVVAVLDAGELSQRLPHVYFAVPRAWRIRLPLDEGPPAITLVMAVPVSEREYAYWRQFGYRSFEQLVEQSGVDVTDLRRPSIL
jgi:tetratricopeptide (TPR) repeat protein